MVVIMVWMMIMMTMTISWHKKKNLQRRNRSYVQTKIFFLSLKFFFFNRNKTILIVLAIKMMMKAINTEHSYRKWSIRRKNSKTEVRSPVNVQTSWDSFSNSISISCFLLSSTENHHSKWRSTSTWTRKNSERCRQTSWNDSILNEKVRLFSSWKSPKQSTVSLFSALFH